MLFLVVWMAAGFIALFSGVLVIVNVARQMEQAAPAQSSRATKPEDALAA